MTETTAADLATRTVSEGTTVWLRSTHKRAEGCICCEGAHVFGCDVRDDAGQNVDLMMTVWRAVRDAPEGARIRCTVTVLDAAGHCPRCYSPQPHLHPAVQAEGEVQVCPHPWHFTAVPSLTRPADYPA